jgi:hypothetical protein
VQNVGVLPALRRPALSLAVLTTASALVLAGCSSDSGTTSASAGTSGSPSTEASSPSATASPTASSTVAVPDGAAVTEQGSKLSFGDTATVIYEPTEGKGTVLRLTVRSVRKGTLADFKGFILDDRYKQKASYYYAKVQVRNLGEGDVGGVAVPLWGVNAANTLLPAVNFTTSFKACPSNPLPKKFGTGATLSTCLVYLSPDRGSLEALSYRPSQEFNPITWTGDITAPKPAPKKKTKKKG